MDGTISFRVDWSTDIGLGHVQRCLALMDALKSAGLRGLFVAAPQAGCESRVVTARGYQARLVSSLRTERGQQRLTSTGAAALKVVDFQTLDAKVTVDTLGGTGTRAIVVDHYGVDGTWESVAKRSLNVPVVAIDGLANRKHTADLVIDPSFAPADRGRWSGLVAPQTRVLRGPRYALIAPRFQEQMAHRRFRDGHIRKVLVSFGGSDPHRLTERTLDALEDLGRGEILLDVVVGAAHADPDSIEARCTLMPGATFHHGTPHMAELIAAADVAIGSGGISIYERAFLGLPAIVIVAEGNQIEQVAEIEKAGAVVCLGTADEVHTVDIASAIEALLNDPACVHRMGRAARRVMNDGGRPGSLRVAEEILSLLHPS